MPVTHSMAEHTRAQRHKGLSLVCPERSLQSQDQSSVFPTYYTILSSVQETLLPLRSELRADSIAVEYGRSMRWPQQPC